MTHDTPFAIQVQDVHKSFKNIRALEGVSLRVPKGSVLGLLGPNGAGKTTLVRIMTTLLQPDKGTAYVAGIDVAQHPDEVRHRIGLAGQYAAVDENLTGQENLEMVGKLYHLNRGDIKQRAQTLLEQFSLTDAARRTLKTYSGGMRRRLDLAASLMGKPEILFLDEPTTGLDPQSRLELWEILQKLVDEGTTLLLTTQYLEEADKLADSIAVINKGRLVAQGTADELKNKIGADVLEVHMHDRKQTDAAAKLLHDLGKEQPTADHAAGIIAITVHDRTKSLIEAVRRLDAAKFEIADVALRRPTLDEVFLSLTDNTYGK